MAAFQSTKTYYHVYRYGLGAMAVFIIGLTVTLILTESEISINDQDLIATWTNTWFLFLMGLVLLGIHVVVNRKASYVQIFSDTVSVESSDGIHEYNLKDVEVLEQIQFFQPPLYRLRIKGAPRTYIFVLNAMYLEFGGFVKDLSDDRNQLEKIKNTLPNTR